MAPESEENEVVGVKGHPVVPGLPKRSIRIVRFSHFGSKWGPIWDPIFLEIGPLGHLWGAMWNRWALIYGLPGEALEAQKLVLGGFQNRCQKRSKKGSHFESFWEVGTTRKWYTYEGFVVLRKKGRGLKKEPK